MICTDCGLWELAPGDLACSWCGASYLRLNVSLGPATFSTEDYPPPVALRIRNESPMGAITLERIQPGQPWITLLPDPSLGLPIAPGTQHIFHLDVDTFAAGTEREGSVTVTALYAPEPQTAILHLQPPTPTGT